MMKCGFEGLDGAFVALFASRRCQKCFGSRPVHAIWIQLKFKFNTDNFMIHPWRVNSGRPVHVPTIRETLKQENIDYDDIGDGLDANVKASSRCVHQQRTDACGPRSHIDQSRSLYMSTKVSCSIM